MKERGQRNEKVLSGLLLSSEVPLSPGLGRNVKLSLSHEQGVGILEAPLLNLQN